MDEPSEHEELWPPTQLRLALFLLWALRYITQNVRDRSGEQMLRTPVRIIIAGLLGLVMLFFDARPPSRVCSIRHSLFSGLPQSVQKAYTVATVENAQKVTQLALERASWQTAFAGMKYVGERIASMLQVTYSHLSMFVNNDLKPLINDHIRPFVNDNIEPVGKALAEQVWRIIRNIIQWTGISDHVNPVLVNLDGTALHGFCVALTGMMKALMAKVGRFRASALIALAVCALVLISRLLSRRIWRGIMRAHAIITGFKSRTARIWRTMRWVFYTVSVVAILGVWWKIIIVKGEEHFGNRDDEL